MMGIKHLTSAAAVMAFTSLVAHSQPGTTPVVGNQPRLEVPETAFNFGYVPQGASISHVFWLKNVGGDTLRITDVRPG